MIDKIRQKILEAEGTLGDDEVWQIIEQEVFLACPDLPLQQYRGMIQRIHAKIRSKLGILSLYINDEQIMEIMINGPSHVFFETREGMVAVKEAFDSVEELEEVIRNIAASVHREINELHPILDARLSDGSRVNAVYKNIAIGGPILTIRKFAKEHISMAKLVQSGMLSPACAKDLQAYVINGYNLFISGGTSTGKTTFLNALSDYIPQKERVIVVEDTTELQLPHIENLVQLECHHENAAGKGEVSMGMLIKTSLRMRPDRIIVGEVRGGEVADMLQAMNTGHDGSMSTGHGNSAEGMLRRLEAMYLMDSVLPIEAIRAQIIEGIDILIHLGRFSDGRRKVLEVQELIGFQDGQYCFNPLYLLDEEQKLAATGNQLKHNWKMKWKA